MLLYEFLLKHQDEVLALTAQKTLDLAGVMPNSDQLKRGLPIFYHQLVDILKSEELDPTGVLKDKHLQAKAASESDEPAVTAASAHPNEVALTESAGAHGTELMRLGYTLSHVVHAYGAMCQAITELATVKKASITSPEFQHLNRCLDSAIAGAVTEFQAHQNSEVENQEVKRLGFLAHELRNALSAVNLSLQLIKHGTVGFAGSTGKVLDTSLKRIETIIDRSLTEVRMRVEPETLKDTIQLVQVVDQIIVTAKVEAERKAQRLQIEIDPAIVLVIDQQLLHSALSNVIQNAIKYSPAGARILVRGNFKEDQIVIEVEDECGGHSSDRAATELFKPFEQRNADREGLGLGLSIARRAVELNHGTIEMRNLPGKGCTFTIFLPKSSTRPGLTVQPGSEGQKKSPTGDGIT